MLVHGYDRGMRTFMPMREGFFELERPSQERIEELRYGAPRFLDTLYKTPPTNPRARFLGGLIHLYKLCGVGRGRPRAQDAMILLLSLQVDDGPREIWRAINGLDITAETLARALACYGDSLEAPSEADPVDSIARLLARLEGLGFVSSRKGRSGEVAVRFVKSARDWLIRQAIPSPPSTVELIGCDQFQEPDLGVQAWLSGWLEKQAYAGIDHRHLWMQVKVPTTASDVLAAILDTLDCAIGVVRADQKSLRKPEATAAKGLMSAAAYCVRFIVVIRVENPLGKAWRAFVSRLVEQDSMSVVVIAADAQPEWFPGQAWKRGDAVEFEPLE
jgi:hypothetical protein